MDDIITKLKQLNISNEPVQPNQIDQLITQLENININVVNHMDLNQINQQIDSVPDFDIDLDVDSITTQLNNLNICVEPEQIINYLKLVFIAMARKSKCCYNVWSPVPTHKYIY